MAHELEMKADGTAAMFSVKETPWHGLGHVIQDAPSIERVLELAGLNWGVKMEDLFLKDGTKTEQRAIMRDQPGAPLDRSILGYSGERYKPLQNSEALDWFKPFVDSGLASFETAGSLRDGQKIWIMCRLNKAEMEIVKGDSVRKYLMLSNGHDGITGIRVGFTPVRVVCANTLAMCHNSGQSKLIRLMHSKKTIQNLEAIQNVVNAADAQFEATAEQYRALANKQINQKDIQAYVTKVFYNDAQAESDREKSARDSLNETITKLFEIGYGNEIPGAKGTAWALYNGATEYLSYVKGRTQDTRLDSLWFGTGKDLNQRAFDSALELVAA